jgi:hypothetical protein
MLIVKLAMLYEGVFALKRWLLLQHLLRVWGGQFPPECPGQFPPEWVVSLRRNVVVTFIRISTTKISSKLRQNIGKIASESGYKTIQKNKCRHYHNHSFLYGPKQTFSKFVILRAANYIANIIISININHSQLL